MSCVDGKSTMRGMIFLICGSAAVYCAVDSDSRMRVPDYGSAIWKKGVAYNAEHKIDCEFFDGHFTLKTLAEKKDDEKEFVSVRTNYEGKIEIICADKKVLKDYKKDSGIVFGDFMCETTTFTNRNACALDEEVRFAKKSRWSFAKKANFNWNNSLLSGLRPSRISSPGYDVSFVNRGLSLREREIKGEHDFVEFLLLNQKFKNAASFCFDAHKLLWITPIGFDVKLNGASVSFRMKELKSNEGPRELPDGEYYMISMLNPENASFRKVIRDEVIASSAPDESITIDENFFGEEICLQPTKIEIYLDRWLNCVVMVRIDCRGEYLNRYQDEKGIGNVTLRGKLDLCYKKVVDLQQLQNGGLYALNDDYKCWINYESGHQLSFDNATAVFSYADSDMPIAVFDMPTGQAELKTSFGCLSRDGICELKFDAKKKVFEVFSKGQEKSVFIKEGNE